MSLSRLPLSYCTNVHPGLSIDEVEGGLDRYTVPIARQFAKPMTAGLWLAEPVVREILSSADGAKRFADRLSKRALTCHTLNAFPYGNFHSQRVKEQVYLPDWTDARRLQYTLDCARILSVLLTAGVEGSVSTLPLGFKGFEQPAGFVDAAARNIVECARELRRLHDQTGSMIRLAIEPEPFCVLEMTDEAIAFFQRLWSIAERENALESIREHIGVCYDICHQAVEFEDAGESIRRLDGAGVRINKVHISCALQLDHPQTNMEGREALKRYVEPRYLHQTIARMRDGRFARAIDLSEQLISKPGDDFASAPAWRIHFHVPVDAERLGPLSTTRPAIHDALSAVAELNYAPHLELETYTWDVLPGAGPADLVNGLTRELLATDRFVTAINQPA